MANPLIVTITTEATPRAGRVPSAVLGRGRAITDYGRDIEVRNPSCGVVAKGSTAVVDQVVTDRGVEWVIVNHFA